MVHPWVRFQSFSWASSVFQMALLETSLPTGTQPLFSGCLCTRGLYDSEVERPSAPADDFSWGGMCVGRFVTSVTTQLAGAPYIKLGPACTGLACTGCGRQTRTADRRCGWNRTGARISAVEVGERRARVLRHSSGGSSSILILGCRSGLRILSPAVVVSR